MAGKSYKMQFFNKPSCNVVLQDYLGQPGNDYDRRYNTLLLTFRVRLTAPPPAAYDELVVYYRRKFSEPLALMTHQSHSDHARDKLSRMLETVQVPPLSCYKEYYFDIVGYILDRVRSIASHLEDPLPALWVVVKINAVLLYLPNLSQSDRHRYDDGPPIYLDGPNSRNYEDYSEDEEEEEDDEDTEVDDERVSCEMRVECVDPSHVSYEVLPDRNFRITLNVRFTPNDYNGRFNVCRTFTEKLYMMVDPNYAILAWASLDSMLNHLQVPQPHSDIVLKKILRGLRAAADRHRGAILDNPYSVMTVVVDLHLLVPKLPSLQMLQLRDRAYNYRNTRAVDYKEDPMDFQIEPRFVAASEKAIKSLEKVNVVEPLSCSICFEDVARDSEATRLPCSHEFHGDCIVKWLKTSKFCPLCRLELKI